MCEGRGNSRARADAQSAPALIWSFPGSGNTWVRILLELATGMPTSSPYHDKSLADLLPGEALRFEGGGAHACARFSALKVHAWTRSYQRELCGGLIDSAIMLVRHPMPAIWSDVQRQVAVQRGEKDIAHGAGSSLSQLPSNFAALAKALAREFALLHTPSAARLSCSGACGDVWFGEQLTRSDAVRYPDWSRDATKRSTILRFEDLADPSLREAALAEALRFAGFEASADRVACAFEQSDQSSTHRSATKGLSARQAFARDPAVEEVVWREVAAAASELGYERHVYR